MKKTTEVKTVAIDLDGTILDFDWDAWVEKRMGYFGNPKRGAIKALTHLKKLGYYIIIHTCRTNTRVNPRYTLGELWITIERLLDFHKIPFDEIWVETGKPVADYYIDDRGIKFENWEQVLLEIGAKSVRTKINISSL